MSTVVDKLTNPQLPARLEPPIPSAVLGLALFIATEVMFFAGLVSAFIVTRAGAGSDWPPAGEPRLPLEVTFLNTVVLLASGFAMHRAFVAAERSGERRRVLRWLGLTCVLGTVFLVVQGAEWVQLIAHGLTLKSSLYGATFYTIVGVHGLHVLGALVALMYVYVKAWRGHYSGGNTQGLRLCRMYWIFVVAIWPILYVLVYP